MTILGLDPTQYPKHPAHFDIENVIRPNILTLHPYRCARDDYSEGILLDANENALGHSIPRINGNGSAKQAAAPDLEPELQATLDLDLHRYPSPRNDPIRERLAAMRGLPGPDYVFLGVGSDEVIDLLMRVCVAPGREKILTTPPTYGMYAVCAQVNDVGVVKVPLELGNEGGEGGEKGRFSLKVEERSALLSALEKLQPLGIGPAVGGNHANFVMIPVLEKNGNGRPDNVRAQRIYKTLAEEEGVVVRYRGSEPGCAGCLRITVGSEEENTVVLKRFEELLRKL
ncbi:predicted protein [Postia placenta Mad-698-R]|uniref:histidinol-phosphate transaminase n=1 Tax=Postia placenta MAD-698-R-SB12 TaxID=670580 RepID=A0A1X6N4W0_9APHY|nr:hypothetical protein POSPLADRAFT_1139676 [Postia placenta MAD-698-R-SB12]EED84906.1 predicted protein [Postia placenta Mad-698-R]OSX63482.1 hypothetical protein POSPLADRAFT_1139676 [Postia placenta MAD-698-R-SB12]